MRRAITVTSPTSTTRRASCWVVCCDFDTWRAEAHVEQLRRSEDWFAFLRWREASREEDAK